MKNKNVILEVEKLKKSFIDETRSFSITDVSMSLDKGEVICLVGPSGSGKSTLLRCLAGLEEIDNGNINLYLDGQKHASKSFIKKHVSFVFQDFNLWPHKTVLENIILAPVLLKKMSRGEAIDSAENLLKKFGLYDKKDVYQDFLSGGQKQRVAIIRALATKPKILLLDEITSALDPELISRVLNLIKVLAKEGQSMIIATHHLKFATEVADKIIFLDNGKKVQESSSRDFVYAQKNERINDFIKTLSLNKQEINVYEGYDQFQAFQLGTLKRFKKGSSKKVVGAVGDRWFECMGEYLGQYEKERSAKGISWQMLLYSESVLEKDIRTRFPDINEFRLLPKDLENPANFYVIEDIVVIQIFGKDSSEAPSIIEIKNPSLVQSYNNYFDLLWSQSTPVED